MLLYAGSFVKSSEYPTASSIPYTRIVAKKKRRKNDGQQYTFTRDIAVAVTTAIAFYFLSYIPSGTSTDPNFPFSNLE
jgi:hypothetical protein